MAAQTPKIRCIPNGPYYLVFEPSPSPVPGLRRANGEPCSAVRSVALCRCGGSRSKPFCDGTHTRNGFSDKRTADAGAGRRESYAGKAITIHDNRAICAHAGHCTDGLAKVFRMREEPWIDPDGASAAEIVETVRRCPSGALGYSIDGVEEAPRGGPPMVTVSANGPYEVTGGIELVGAKFADGASRDHYTLCRCGASKNKPFCDGSHWAIGFKDE